jgi:predicted enzyme related to lactoylglutathione lyase
VKLFINVDVPSIADGARFYVDALGLRVGRTMGPDMVELLGAGVPIYLLEKAEGTSAVPGGAPERAFVRHWTPVHMDFVVEAIEPAVARAETAGAHAESEITEHAYGRMALFSDPFGNGFCLLEMNARGYDAITTS